ncbi:MAG: response regulator transcription factor [Hyphomonadaceae bacterium]
MVDDDAGVRETVADFLEMEGYQVRQAANVQQARNSIAGGAPDLVLLDLNMPGGDGLSFAAEIRGGSSLPIIIISGKSAMVDRVVGLEVGADDYLAKPFELRELLARIRAVLRRARPSDAAASQAQPAPPPSDGSGGRVAHFGGGFRLCSDLRALKGPDGAVIDLTGAEYTLLAAMVDRPNRVLDRDSIYGLLHRGDPGAFDRSVDTLMSRLRRKLEPFTDAAALIKTVRGEGYVLASAVNWTND